MWLGQGTGDCYAQIGGNQGLSFPRTLGIDWPVCMSQNEKEAHTALCVCMCMWLCVCVYVCGVQEGSTKLWNGKPY